MFVPFAVALLVVVLPGGTVTADGAPASCRFAGARTIASSASARVVQRSGVTYGCMYSVNRRVVLGAYERTQSSTIEQRNLRLAGRYVAFGETAIGKEYIGFIVRVFDLRSGKPVSLSETGAPTQRAKDETFGNAFGVGPTVSVRLRATGDVAWLARVQYTEADPRYEIRKREGQRTTLLSRGVGIDPASLGLVGSRLSWREAGRRRHVMLGPTPRAQADRQGSSTDD